MCILMQMSLKQTSLHYLNFKEILKEFYQDKGLKIEY